MPSGGLDLELVPAVEEDLKRELTLRKKDSLQESLQETDSTCYLHGTGHKPSIYFLTPRFPSSAKVPYLFLDRGSHGVDAASLSIVIFFLLIQYTCQ